MLLMQVPRVKKKYRLEELLGCLILQVNAHMKIRQTNDLKNVNHVKNKMQMICDRGEIPVK